MHEDHLTSLSSIKERIYDCIHSDNSSFERQLESSKSAQTRLRSLATNVDNLSHAVSDPKVFDFLAISPVYSHNVNRQA
jgi:hypothetical protein